MAFVAIPAILAGLSSLFAINDQIGAARAKKAAEMAATTNNIKSGKGLRRKYMQMNGSGLSYKYRPVGGALGGRKRRVKHHKRTHLRPHMRRTGKGMLGDLLGNIPLIGPLIKGIGLGTMTRAKRARLMRLVHGRGLSYKYYAPSIGGLLAPGGGLLRPGGGMMDGSMMNIGCGVQKKKQSRHIVRGHYRMIKAGRGIKRVHVKAHLRR